MTAKQQRARRIVAGLAVGAGAVALVTGPLASAQGTDPLTEPVPRPEYVDDARSFIASVDFTAADTGTPAGITVAGVATPGTDHLDAQVTVESEGDGQLLRSTTMPNPAMAFADHVGAFFQAGRYDVLVPFDTRVETIRLTTADGDEIVAVDTAPAVRQYCIDNPDDPGCLEADLSVDGVEATGPRFAVLGVPTTVPVTSTITNNGPDGPVDAVASRSASAGSGLTVSPSTTRKSTLADLAVDETREVDDGYTVTCDTPGTHTLTLTTSVAPKRAWVVDAESGNDSRTVDLSIDCAIPVTINIQPGSAANPVNLTGSTLPVAVLTTAEGEYGNPLAFDATTIDPATLRFGSEAGLLLGNGVPEIHGAIHPEDSRELDERTRDRDRDALTHFRPRSDALTVSDTRACVYDRTTVAAGGFSFFGCDVASVRS